MTKIEQLYADTAILKIKFCMMKHVSLQKLLYDRSAFFRSSAKPRKDFKSKLVYSCMLCCYCLFFDYMGLV
ncbi:hypothetical protein QVD17_01194 [Tagetes erecta]|uniref:Uncharacterized protein n=1 Tax=Tagetes erecta TaxID=13708 RepID=A0AAD8LA73_TARER|nr:hypothetical protein QVD17_01194 [Tagetes erecta]